MNGNVRRGNDTLTAMYESDRELLEACRQGDAHAWSCLLERYERLVYSVPLSCGLTAEDAADITQMTFICFLQGLGELGDDSNLGGWLATVARRHAWRLVAQRRRERVGYEADIVDELRHLSDGLGQRALLRWELLDWLNEGLNDLDGRCRELLLSLYFAPGPLTYADVAGKLGIAVGSVGPLRARCLQKLRHRLKEKNLPIRLYDSGDD